MGPPSSSNNSNSSNGSSTSAPPPEQHPTTANLMKLGGDRLRRRNKNPASSQPQQQPHPPRYNPAIYTYICRGAFHATSEDSHEGGVCNGFKSQLEVLYNERQESLTRAEALKRFTSMNAEFEFDPTAAAGGNDQHGDDMYGGGLHEQTQAVMISPALIFKDKDLMDQQINHSADGNDGNKPNNNKRKDPVVVNPILNQHNIHE